LNASSRCTADARAIAQPVLDGLKAYTARIEAAKTSSGYPDTMAPAQIPGVAVAYHGLKTTYALTITVTQFTQLRSLFGCTQFHRTDLATAQQRNLYAEQSGGAFFRPSVTFMPAVGLYFVQRPPQAGAESFRVYKLPATAPSQPFAMRTSAQSCTAELRSVAQQMLSRLQAHFAGGAPAPGWTIAPHAAKAGTWYALEPQDMGAIPALLNCAHVSSATKDELTQLGWDAAALPSLNFTPKLGLYMLTPQRRGGGGAQ
jgi:hypothetical protein